MNIREELIELYATAKAAGKLDLAFRILACLAKMKPDVVSVEMLSSDELTSIITECGVLTPETTLDSQPSGNHKEEHGSGNEERENDSNNNPPTPLTHAHIQAKAQQGRPQ